LKPIHIRFGGYQPATSVHTKAANVLGQALVARLGAAVRFDLDGDIMAAGHQAADLLNMVESGAMTMCYFSSSYLASRMPECALLDLSFTIRLTGAERAQFIAAVAPVVEVQRQRFGNQLFGYLPSSCRYAAERGQ
jgi:TRAP-type C4-dicarboxylate transport system substrate-binding protein